MDFWTFCCKASESRKKRMLWSDDMAAMSRPKPNHHPGCLEVQCSSQNSWWLNYEGGTWYLSRVINSTDKEKWTCCCFLSLYMPQHRFPLTRTYTKVLAWAIPCGVEITGYSCVEVLCFACFCFIPLFNCFLFRWRSGLADISGKQECLWPASMANTAPDCSTDTTVQMSSSFNHVLWANWNTWFLVNCLPQSLRQWLIVLLSSVLPPWGWLLCLLRFPN